MRVGMYLATLRETPPAESDVFTDAERRYCLELRYPAPHLAARYAAKRAVRLALELRAGASLGEIEVRRERGRPPQVVVFGEAAEAARGHGATRIHLSLSHSGDYAVALVVAE